METLDEWQNAYSSDIAVRYDTDDKKCVWSLALAKCGCNDLTWSD